MYVVEMVGDEEMALNFLCANWDLDSFPKMRPKTFW